MRTIHGAGYKALPYHDNVPSFGDWGWILAWNSEETQARMLGRITGLEEFAVGEAALRYLTPPHLKAAVSFGKGALETENQAVNTLMSPVLLRFYLSESWLR